jgi:hypothetical protein
MEKLKGLYNQAETKEDKQLWRAQIVALQGDLFDGEELQRIRAEEEAEEARAAEAAAAEERRRKKADEEAAAKAKAKEADRGKGL